MDSNQHVGAQQGVFVANAPKLPAALPTLTSSTNARLEALQSSFQLAIRNAQTVCDRLWGQGPETDPRSNGIAEVRRGAHGELDGRLDDLASMANELIGLTARLEQGI